MENNIYTFHTDPGHGWLEVSLKEILLLNIQDKITAYSYVSRKAENNSLVFLEEDVDAPFFLEVKRKAAQEVKIEEKNVNQDSFIRHLTPYSEIKKRL